MSVCCRRWLQFHLQYGRHMSYMNPRLSPGNSDKRECIYICVCILRAKKLRKAECKFRKSWLHRNKYNSGRGVVKGQFTIAGMRAMITVCKGDANIFIEPVVELTDTCPL